MPWPLAAVVLLLSGCSPLDPLPEDHYYRLVSRSAGPPLAEPLLGGVLYVAPLRAAGVRRDRPLLYSRPPYVRFQQYNYHHWEEAPTRLIQHRIVEVVRDRQVAAGVSEAPAAGARFRLMGHLERFERLLDGDGSAALVQLHLTLVEVGSAAPPLLDAVYRRQAAAAGADMEATVLAFSAAVDGVIEDFVTDLAAL